MGNGKDIHIHIKSSQSSADSGKDEMEFYTEGKLFQKGGVIFITYKESEISGMENTTSTLRLEQNTVSLIRMGNINTKLFFVEGVTTKALYGTELGNFDMDINTHTVVYDIKTEGECSLYLKYTLEITGLGVFENELSLRFKN